VPPWRGPSVTVRQCKAVVTRISRRYLLARLVMSSKPSSSRATEPEREDAAKTGSDEQDGKDDGNDMSRQDVASQDLASPKKRKPRGKAISRDFVEVNRWSLDDHGEEEIHKFVMAYLDDLEEQG